MSKNGQRLFKVGKVGLFLDGFSPGTEKRHGEEVKTITLALRMQPFDAKLATAIDEGLGGDSGVRAALFKLSSTEPKPHLERVNLSLGCPRQNLEIFAAPDTEQSRLMFTQCKISGTYARTQKNINGYAFCFKATYGPVGRDELEAIFYWYLGQQFITLTEAEPGLFDDEDEDAEVEAGPVIDGRSRPAPMWDDADEAPSQPAAAEATPEKEAARKPSKRGTRKKAGRHNPETERAAQVKAAKVKGATH
jgi:hypothetical protein